MTATIHQNALRLKAKLDEIQDRELSIEAKLLLGEARTLAAAITGALGATPSTTPIKTQEKKTVLIVDDDEDVQRTLSYLLPKRGAFEVLTLSDPTQAVELIKARRPDVVLMDLMMPQMTGFELLQRLKADPETSHVKVLIGSSRSYDKDRVAVLESGAHDFIAKPYNVPELVLRLQHLLG